MEGKKRLGGREEAGTHVIAFRLLICQQQPEKLKDEGEEGKGFRGPSAGRAHTLQHTHISTHTSTHQRIYTHTHHPYFVIKIWNVRLYSLWKRHIVIEEAYTLNKVLKYSVVHLKDSCASETP